MNKPLLIGLAALILIGAGFFVLRSSKPSSNQDSSPPVEQADETKDSTLGSISGSLKDLFARGIPMECTFSRTDENGSTSGTVYVAGERMHGEFSMTQPDGTTLQSSMIRDNDYGYMWSDNLPQGTKVRIEDPADPEVTPEGPTNQEPFALNEEKVDYSCKPWVINNAKFVPPSNIEFLDLSAQMEQLQQTQESIEGVSCSACDQIPAGAARDQCRQSLGCN